MFGKELQEQYRPLYSILSLFPVQTPMCYDGAGLGKTGSAKETALLKAKTPFKDSNLVKVSCKFFHLMKHAPLYNDMTEHL